MGFGTYSVSNSTARGDVLLRANATVNDVFVSKSINNAMNPYGLTVRESRDSAEHPNSLAIILGLDVTGSMGSIPLFLVKEGLPNIMDKIIKGGENDPQVLFLGIGDHQCDRSPLQVAQFESNDELLEKWLKDVYLEGGGGSNAGESYHLAWYLAAFHTSIDCFEKRGRKGLLFTIGDEPVLEDVSKSFLRKTMGEGQYENLTALQLLDKARERYDVYHVHVKETASGSRQHVIDGWKQLMSDNLIVVNRSKDIAQAIADVVVKNKKVETTTSVSSEEIL